LTPIRIHDITYLGMAALPGIAWFPDVAGATPDQGLAASGRGPTSAPSPHDTGRLHVMGLAAALLACFVVVPFGLVCQYALQFAGRTHG
jgi:hypothetical protein